MNFGPSGINSYVGMVTAVLLTVFFLVTYDNENITNVFGEKAIFTTEYQQIVYFVLEGGGLKQQNVKN